MKVRILVPLYISGVRRKPGDVVDVTKHEGIGLIAHDRAEKVAEIPAARTVEGAKGQADKDK